MALFVSWPSRIYVPSYCNGYVTRDYLRDTPGLHLQLLAGLRVGWDRCLGCGADGLIAGRL